MAIKAGQIIHAGNGVMVIDRIQTGGPGQLNIPTEKINELGNYKSVATIRDVPDLSFTAESFDVSTEFEKLMCGVTGAIPGTGLDLATCKPVDIAGQFKAGLQAVDSTAVVASVALPFLYMEQISYRFGLRDNASMTGTLRGDSIFYCPGPTYIESAPGSGTAGQTVVTANPVFPAATADDRFVLSVTAGSRRLTKDVDYTESGGSAATPAAVTVTIKDAVAATDTVRIVYSSSTPLAYPQASPPHANPPIKPAAVRGRDIEIYVGTNDGTGPGGIDGYDPANTPAENGVFKLTSVQSVQADWRVTIEKDEEFGNYYAVATDFTDVPQVNGSIDIKPPDVPTFMDLVQKITGAADGYAIGPDTAIPLPLDIVIKDPDPDSANPIVKRLHVPDARFTVPGYQGRVQQKLTVTLPFESDEGTLLVFED